MTHLLYMDSVMFVGFKDMNEAFQICRGVVLQISMPPLHFGTSKMVKGWFYIVLFS